MTCPDREKAVFVAKEKWARQILVETGLSALKEQFGFDACGGFFISSCA